MTNIETTIKVDEIVYYEAKELLKQIGMSYSQAISLFNNMIVSNQGLPFEFQLPQEDTKTALKELDEKNGKYFDNIDELFDDLDS